MNESTARNIRVQDRYDELMRVGRHGHYETMFQVVREEIESLRRQLEASKKREVMLPDALEYHQAQTRPIQRTEEALAATADLSGLVLCDAEPVLLFRRKGVSNDFCTCDASRFNEVSKMPHLFEVKKLYKAKEQP